MSEKTLEHFDNCPVYKKFNQCTCLLLEAEASSKYDIAVKCMECEVFFEPYNDYYWCPECTFKIDIRRNEN